MAANALVNRDSQAWNASQAKFESDQKKSKAIGITCLVVGILAGLAVLSSMGMLPAGPVVHNMTVFYSGLGLFGGGCFLTCGTLPFGIDYIRSQNRRNQHIMSGDNANTFIAGVSGAQNYETLMGFESSVNEPETLAKYGIMELAGANGMRADLATHKHLNLRISKFEGSHPTEMSILSQEGTMRDNLISRSQPVRDYLQWERDLQTLNSEFETKHQGYVSALASPRGDE